MLENVSSINQTYNREALIHNAKLKKAEYETSPEFLENLAKSSDNSKTKDLLKEMESQTVPKATNELTAEGMLKLMIEKSKFTSLDKDKNSESDNTNMMVAIANMNSMNDFKKSVQEFIETTHLSSAMNLQGKEVEAYQPVDQKYENYYKAYPEKRPTTKGTVIDSSKERDKFYLHLDLGGKEIIKVEPKNVKKVVFQPESKEQKLVKELGKRTQLADLLKGKTMKGFLPLDEEMMTYKDFIDPKDRPTFVGEVIDVIKEKANTYLSIKQEGKPIIVDLNDIINL